MATELTLTMPGKPLTWARARTVARDGKVRFFTAADREDRMGELKMFWKAKGYERIEKPTGIAMRCTFVFDRPDSHFGTGRNAGVLKERFRYARPPAGKNGGDLDNLVKLVKDSLTGVAYRDDAQIAQLQAEKRYGEPGEAAHTEIILAAMDDGTELEEPPDPSAQLELASATAGAGDQQHNHNYNF
jgi:Holliday junction resolvase RusA-like endonuclease